MSTVLRGRIDECETLNDYTNRAKKERRVKKEDS